MVLAPEIVSRIEQLAGRNAELATDLRKIEQLAPLDVQSSLNLIRRICEAHLLALCKRTETSWGDAQPTLERMIGPLIAKKHVPSGIAAHVRTVQAITSPASHHQADEFGGDHLDVAVRALLNVLQSASSLVSGTAPPLRDRRRAPWIAASVLCVGAGAAIAVFALRSGSRPAELSCPADMVLVPAGSYLATVEGDGTLGNGIPRRRVDLGAYCIDRTEVTTEAAFQCFNGAVCPSFSQHAGGGNLSEEEARRYSQYCNGRRFSADSSARATFAKHPMNCVTVDEAADYCKNKDKRLPTETEWEVAATGGLDVPHTWGAAPPTSTRLNVLSAPEFALAIAMLGDRAILDPEPLYEGSDGWPTTAPVGSFPDGASPFGALDMEGNVSEWTSSTWPGNGRPVIRGSAWTYVKSPRTVVSYRRPMLLDDHSPTIGFRCAWPR